MPVRLIKGSWVVDIRAANHKRYRKTSPQNSKGGAQAYEAYLRQRLAQGKPLIEEAPKVTKQILFRDFASEWLETYVKTNNKPSEQCSKETMLRLHLIPFFGSLPLDQINGSVIEQYKTKKISTHNRKTVNNHLICLGKCLRMAVEWGRLQVAPRISSLKLTKPKMDFLSPLETAQLLRDATEPIWNEMTRMAVRTGMRRGELVALDWSDVDLVKGEVMVRRSYVNGIMGTPKNHKERQIPLTNDVREMLSNRKERKGLIFCRADGTPLDKSINGGAIIRICKRVGLRSIGWHTLRHTYASTLVSEGIPLTIVSELLGHSDIRVTMRYAHLAPSQLHDSVRVLERAEQRALEQNGQQMGSNDKSQAENFSLSKLLSPISSVNPNKNASNEEANLLVGRLGVEPRTLGLRGPCSTS